VKFIPLITLFPGLMHIERTWLRRIAIVLALPVVALVETPLNAYIDLINGVRIMWMRRGSSS
jgi:hypothetical protein